MIIFLVLWATALALVYKKIKATGQTAPNKGIFIAHIFLVSLYILFYAIPSLIFKSLDKINPNLNKLSAVYIMTEFDSTIEVLIFFLVFYVLLKKGG